MANTIRIAGIDHELEKVSHQGRAGPKVNININDINEDTETGIDHSVKIVSDKGFVDDGSIVFYKQHGKYSIILGRITAEEAMNKPKFNNVLTGHLITSVVLKKFRV